MEPIFYDCEASGLEGVPIEIGWACYDQASGTIVSESHLIRPPADWFIDDVWDQAAEALHGITRDDLHCNGEPVWRIAARMNAVLAGRELFSDAPSDEAWLRQIFDAAGADPAFMIRRMNAYTLIQKRAVKRGLSDTDWNRIKAEANTMAPRRHRAEADAKSLALLWARAMGNPKVYDIGLPRFRR